ncbi:bi-domain-containing oxidoreductase [Horticoccus sp. 23ND18S-11]|uniref:bi-domain-containing oxidoreductase n=1 Tax=Horticoccus sp. 23ND18S-11 TaxID=3391832 RepID=UPI0039C98134
MRQILSNLRSGEITLADVPAPVVEPGHVLIATRRTLVSQGTEKMLVQFGKASLFQKARSQPEKVRQVMDKIRTDGLMPTIDAVFRRLDEPLPLGYCNAGVVLGVGAGVAGFTAGDRVASNGHHAEVVSIPANLVAKIPEGVADDAAAFTVAGAIALQGIRLAKPEFGETVVVIGLGLIGQLTAQLLRAAGCRVIAFDLDEAKIALARAAGVTAVKAEGEQDAIRQVEAATHGIGADAVIITASTASHDVIARSARMSRQRGRIVLVGVVGLNLNRADFYAKELSFQVSCSYGPGRYDADYEEKGHDYPPGFVRWTENRNFQAVLEALASGALNVAPLITQRVPLAEFQAVYDTMDTGLASLLVYEGSPSLAPTVLLPQPEFAAGAGGLAVIGAGNFARMTVLPALAAAKAPVRAIVSASGVSGTTLARKYGVPVSTTDLASVLKSQDVNGVIITTRHHQHAAMAIAALRAGKHVLVEKPLCIHLPELAEIEAVMAAQPAGGPTLSVGYNRRFAPQMEKMKSLLGAEPGAITFIATMNAGAVPAAHWVSDPEIGGGRILGEACHLIDLAIFLAASPVVAVSAVALADSGESASIVLRHGNGSTAAIQYLANGHRAVSKERIEVHSRGRTLLLDNFRELTGHGFTSFGKLKGRQDKGHARQFAQFADRMRAGGPALIPWPEIVNSTRATFAVLQAIAERRVIAVETTP